MRIDLEASTFQRRPCYRYIRATDQLPRPSDLHTQELAEIPAPVRLFNPTGVGTWWIAAYEPETRIAWGAVHLDPAFRATTAEMVGPISMVELVAFRGRFGLPIERDLHYRPRPLAQIIGDLATAVCTHAIPSREPDNH
jgi:hypothetical protein